MTRRNAEGEALASDATERSNASSSRSDLNSRSEVTERFEHAPGNIEMLQCPALVKADPLRYQACYCQKYEANRDAMPGDDSGRGAKGAGGGGGGEWGGGGEAWQRINWKWPRRNYVHKKTYDKGVHRKPEGIPRRGLPAEKESGIQISSDAPEKLEIYYFDHGNSAYYTTTDLPPIVATDRLSVDIESIFRRFWAEIFGFLHIGLCFLTTTVLQLLRCVLFSLVRPLIVGTIQLVADYFIKPLLSIVFNGLIQPIFIVVYNMTTSFRDCCEPLAATLGFFVRELSILLKSCRIIEIVQRSNGNDVA